MNMQHAVEERYSEGARMRATELCCPVDYAPELLQILPQEIIERDYGCGDPSRYVLEGDTILDLGSGGGKVCYMAAQLAGENGYVIGVDMNDAMLALARKYQDEMAQKLGGERVAFRKGYIQDLALDVEALEQWLAQHPVTDINSLEALEQWQQEQRCNNPMIPDGSVDLVISNCVLNLVEDRYKQDMVAEIFRVLKPGGRIAISDIVSDEPVPQHLKEDDELWSGCISGAFLEHQLLEVFYAAGFQGICFNQWSSEPWRVVDGIEFRSVTITAIKGEGGPCLDKGHAVIYRGPFSHVRDDEGNDYPRGQRIAVCERTFRMLTDAPYRECFIGITPGAERAAVPWCSPAGTMRPPHETRSGVHTGATSGSSCCG
jgi:SAM-dependent methyltransferase